MALLLMELLRSTFDLIRLLQSILLLSIIQLLLARLHKANLSIILGHLKIKCHRIGLRRNPANIQVATSSCRTRPFHHKCSKSTNNSLLLLPPAISSLRPPIVTRPSKCRKPAYLRVLPHMVHQLSLLHNGFTMLLQSNLPATDTKQARLLQ